MKILFLHHPNLSSVIKHFTPNWFAVNMGTGVTALCLDSIPWQDKLLHSIGAGIWILNSILFAMFFCIWLTGVIAYPQNQLNLLKHSSLPFFLGCLPMALTTIINGFILFGIPMWGGFCLQLAHGLWYVNAFLSLLVVIAVPYFMFIHHEHKLESMTAIWLLPFVAAEVSASSAGMIAQHLSGNPALTLIILGYMLWGISVPLAFIIIGILFQRMAFHQLPSKELAATIWLPLGPISMGALSLMTLGVAAGQVNLIFVFILLGFSTWILIMALMITLHYARQGLSYSMTFWSFTFPLGVYALSILTLGKLTQITFFSDYGTLLTVALTGVWFWVASKTLPGLIRGNLIKNPLI